MARLKLYDRSYDPPEPEDGDIDFLAECVNWAIREDAKEQEAKESK